MFCQFIAGKRRGGFSRRALIVLSILALFFLVDGINSLADLILDQAPFYSPRNDLRFVTGLFMGVLIAALLYPVFTQTVWQHWLPESALDQRWAAPVLLFGSMLLLAGALSGSAIALSTLAILSITSVIAILSLIYTVILLMLFKQENRYNHFIELTPALLSGMVLMVSQIALFDLVRFLLTRTWNELPL